MTESGDWHGKHALVTGASSGIGEGVALELARAGARVSLAARRAEQLADLARRIHEAGGVAEVLPADLSVPGSGRELGRRALALGQVDVLVNNAGTLGGVSVFVDKTPEQLREAAELNFVQPMELLHIVLPTMIARGSGSVVSVSSVSAFAATPKSSTYIATKRAIAALDEVLRTELHDKCVHVLTVYPGPVTTPMLTQSLAGDPFTSNLRFLPTGDVTTLARKIRRAIERRQDVVVYPASFGGLRWTSPMIGPAMQALGPLLDRLGAR